MRCARISGLSFAAPWLLAAGVAVAQVPPDLGKSEIRCDAAGCALGACVVRDLVNDPVRIMGTARIIPSISNGQPDGFRLFAIRPGSLLHQLGIENGDTLKAANGHVINSPQTAQAAYEAVRDAKKITLELLRRGQPVQRVMHTDRRPLGSEPCPPPPPPLTVPAARQPETPPAEGAPLKPRADQEMMSSLKKDIECKGERCKLKNGAFDRILSSMDLLSRSARVVPAMQDGNPIGFKLFAIRPGSLFALLLFRNGDLVRKVNGQDFSSPEKALEIYSKLRDAKIIPVEIERAGKPLTLTYSIER
jgi:S1-C subfamily serine protease